MRVSEFSGKVSGQILLKTQSHLFQRPLTNYLPKSQYSCILLRNQNFAKKKSSNIPKVVIFFL